ncbi:MAG: serine/threonine-protein phosphatase [Alphaproteobacteria bacterium]|nr:serine/threonine-protein phosphatase [Alphaproteobacteria bacterium]
MTLSIDSRTHIGLVHHTNEDSFTVFATPSGHLLAVCDGMGGMGRGDEASAIAVRVLEERLSDAVGFAPDQMESAVQAADVEIRKRLAVPGNTPGSTAVLVHVDSGLAHVTWAGDSRAYLVREGAVISRTRDHKLVNELVEAGELTEQEARLSTLAHVVTKALGGRGPNEPPIRPDSLSHPWKLKQGDKVLLCSDGLCDLVEDHEIGKVLEGTDLAVELDTLVQMALDRGGHDNITIILARWDGADFDEEGQQTPVFTDLREHVPNVTTPEMAKAANSTWQDEDLTPRLPNEADQETIPPAPERLDSEEAEPTDDTDVGSGTPPIPERREATPDEQPKPWLAALVAVLAIALILLGILLMQGVFTNNVKVDVPDEVHEK